MLTFKQYLKVHNTKIPALDGKREVYMYAPFGVISFGRYNNLDDGLMFNKDAVEYQGPSYEQAIQHLQQYVPAPEQLKQLKTVKGEYIITSIQQGVPVFIFEVNVDAYKTSTHAQEDLYGF
jgi:hypothetical protein